MKQHGLPKKGAHKPFFHPGQIRELKKFACDKKAISSLWNGKPAVKVNYRQLRTAGFVFGGKNGKGEKKGMIVQVPKLKEIIYYPKPSEALRFMLAAKDLEPGGSASRYPGAVGVMRYSYSLARPSWAIVNLLQSNYASRKCDAISRSQFSKHGGWRHHVLDYFFKWAIKGGIKQAYFFPRSETSEKIFVEIAKRNGFEPTKSIDGIKVIRPSSNKKIKR